MTQGLRERLVVVWRVSARCNLACAFCGYDRTLTRQRAAVAPERVLAFARVLAEYAAVSGRQLHLSFLGGEPLLYEPLEVLEPQLLELRLSLGMTSNGTLGALGRVRERWLRFYDEVTLSVDALGAEYEALRRWPGGFERLAETVMMLRGKRYRESGLGLLPRLRINVVLMRSTIASFPQLCHELARCGADEITFNELGGRERPEFHAKERLLPLQVASLARRFPGLEAELLRQGVVLRGGERYLRRLADSARGHPWPIIDCEPGERFLFVDEFGRISPCSFTSDEYAVTTDEVSSVAALAKLPQRLSHLRAGAVAAACRDCRATHMVSKFEPVRPSERTTAFWHEAYHEVISNAYE